MTRRGPAHPTVDVVATPDTLAPTRTERRQGGRLYGRTATEITGPLQPTGSTVRYRAALTRRQQIRVQVLGWLHVALALGLIAVLLVPGDLPWRGLDPLQNLVAA